MTFTALQDFFSEEAGSQYVKGMTYTVRPGNDKLSALVKEWIAAGKVMPGGVAAEISGKG